MSPLSLFLLLQFCGKYVVYVCRGYNLSMLHLSRTIEVGAERFKIPDILFNPYLSQVSEKSIISRVHVC